nr:hypothetical protein [Tanacetum cinerariifolium]
MANQEQNPPHPEQSFVAIKQVSFNLEDIILNTNNEVALLYPEHTNSDFFKSVLNFISKCCLKEPFTRSLHMYKEYLAEFWYSAKALENSKVSVRVNTFRNTIGANYLPHSSEYVAPPSIDIVRPWFETISKEATKGGSSKEPTVSKTRHLKTKKESSLAIDSNLSQTLASTPVVAKMHKEDQQATGDTTSLGVTSEVRTNPQLSSGNDALVVSITKADPRKYAPSDFVPQQQGMNKGTTNTSYDHLIASIDPHASSIARQVKEEEASSTIKLKDLAKLVSNAQPSIKDLDSPEDDHVIVVEDSDEDKEDEVLILQSQKHKLKLKKNKAKAEVALLKAQPSFPNVRQLNELLISR